MIKTIIATTEVLDNVYKAINEILGSLNLKKNLLKNSVGIISCHADFIESGVVKNLCTALPFDCIGATTCLCSAGNRTSQMMLAITVLTSDDCSFETVEIPVIENHEDAVKAKLSPLLEKSQEKPALILSYFPFLITVGGDMLINAIDKVTGGIPLFGTVAFDIRENYSASRTIHNGISSPESVVLCLVRGNLKSTFLGTSNCTFEITTLETKNIGHKATITESKDNILIKVNDQPVLKYVEKYELKREELHLGYLPLILDNNDGKRTIARSLITVTQEGYIACGGTMPEGSSVSFGRIDGFAVINTTEKALKPLLDKDHFILSYSCMARYLAMGVNSLAEAEKVKEIVGNGKYMYACSAGEICPLPDKWGNLKNVFHNYTNVFCRIG